MLHDMSLNLVQNDINVVESCSHLQASLSLTIGTAGGAAFSR